MLNFHQITDVPSTDRMFVNIFFEFKIKEYVQLYMAYVLPQFFNIRSFLCKSWGALNLRVVQTTTHVINDVTSDRMSKRSGISCRTTTEQKMFSCHKLFL
jgi:hypothetical protein